jgi:ADP-heptose:LPS heptosyltransferase
VIDASRILVVRLGAIGDALRVLPAVRRLRLERPAATIGWAVESWVHPVLSGNPNVDRFHVLRRAELSAGPVRALREVLRFARELRLQHYEVVLDFHGLLKSGLVARGSRARTRIGYARGDEAEGNHLCNNVHVRLHDRWENRVTRFLRLLQPLGIDGGFDPAETGLYVPEDEIWKARAWYAKAGAPALAVYPGTSRAAAGYGRWPVDKWSELLRAVKRDGLASTIFWGPDDADFAGEIARRAPESCSLAPQTSLGELMAMIGCFGVFLGANTAAMHMAWLQRVPTAYFPGPALPRTDHPLAPVPWRALWAEEHYREGVSKRLQPEVVRAVPVETVLRAVRQLLDSQSTNPRSIE